MALKINIAPIVVSVIIRNGLECDFWFETGAVVVGGCGWDVPRFILQTDCTNWEYTTISALVGHLTLLNASSKSGHFLHISRIWDFDGILWRLEMSILVASWQFSIKSLFVSTASCNAAHWGTELFKEFIVFIESIVQSVCTAKFDWERLSERK